MQQPRLIEERLGIYGYLGLKEEFEEDGEYNPVEFLTKNFLGFCEQLPHDDSTPPQVLVISLRQYAEGYLRPVVFMGPKLPKGWELSESQLWEYKNCLVIDPHALETVIHEIWNQGEFETLVLLWRLLGRYLRLFVQANTPYKTKNLFALKRYEEYLIDAAPNLKCFFQEEPEHCTNAQQNALHDAHFVSGLFTGLILGSFDGSTFNVALVRDVLLLKCQEFNVDPERWLQWLRKTSRKFF